jgi:aspartyl-tRNA(Asn)/glutamyl-tRNA(Gln) amidotransferase subunit C
VNLETKDLEKLARLARLDLSSQDQTAVLASLDAVLNWVGSLSQAPTQGVAPMAHPHDLALRLRDDVATPLPDRALLMQNAPQASGGLFIVPRVVE